MFLVIACLASQLVIRTEAEISLKTEKTMDMIRRKIRSTPLTRGPQSPSSVCVLVNVGKEGGGEREEGEWDMREGAGKEEGEEVEGRRNDSRERGREGNEGFGGLTSISATSADCSRIAGARNNLI